MVILIILFGGALRFYMLGENPLWIDEVFFGFLVKDGNVRQEFITVWIAQLFGFQSEFWLRFQSAFFGTLTIPAIYFVVKTHKIQAALLVSIFPLFVFWSRMARPYAAAGFFLVLSWRWWYMMIPAILVTPIALVGIIRHKWYVVLGFIILAVGFFLIRPDADRSFWNVEQLFYSSRWYYLPILTGILLVFDRLLPYLTIRPINKNMVVQKRSKVQRLAECKRS